MASGIYRLTFSSGKYYIGKSLDLETRWKQHFNKFATGKAARPMQLEYDKCGLPKTEPIFLCHRDHIDILEEWIIDQEKGPNMLNTTYPEVTRTPEIAALIENSRDLLKQSTWDHLKIIGQDKSKQETAELKAQRAMNLVKSYKSRGRIIDEDFIEVINTAAQYKRKYEHFEELLDKKDYELFRLKILSLWDRIFNYKVYV